MLGGFNSVKDSLVLIERWSLLVGSHGLSGIRQRRVVRGRRTGQMKFVLFSDASLC